ncbi:MAG: glycoside hydrolase family 95 protein [Dysgonamonadaceae bacterium]|jgi:alpha-L-fucosidase 2|nr:glycoside hydrolase family 95 protein [Dysgonamonadaceae bacterium]
MNTKFFYYINVTLFTLLSILVCNSCFSPNKSSFKKDMILWYDKPGDVWLDGMPVGNGLVAGMVFGKTYEERIALNESSFWSGRPHDYNDPDAGKYFSQIKSLVYAGQFQEAEKIIDTKFYGIPVAQQAFQPLGDLLLTFPEVDTTSVGNYRRSLDMETGIASVTYTSGGITYTREVFASYPDKVMVVRIETDKKKSLSMDVALKSHFQDVVAAKSNQLIMDGAWKGPLPENWLIGRVEGEGLKFRTVVNVFPEGGESEAGDARLSIRGAHAVTLILSAATSYVNYNDISADPAERCDQVLAGASGKKYTDLRKTHVADFNNLMGRVHLTVGDAAKNEKPIDQRLADMKNGEEDTNLEALCFQFGRYALVSSSRAGGQPANLQAIWNEDITPNWGSKYTININTEMNYWPTEVCNLPECHQPLFDMLEDISETGAKTAQIYYDCKGWVTHHNIDLWRGTAPVDAARFGMWPLGGAWLCQDIWEHYAFSGNIEFLKKYYPVMKGSAEFLLDLLEEHPRLGYLVTPFSMSPEHGFIDSNGKLAFVSPGPTMDMAIIRELFPHCIEAAKILGIDDAFSQQLAEALLKLPPYKVSSRGFVQEWIEDWEGGQQGHNFSANFPFFPGKSILFHRESDKELVKATNNWMDTRRGRGGFPVAWDICMWSRLERGDKTAQFIHSYVANSVANNLHNRGSNQSDGTFGFSAGVAESLLQSHAGKISLLPALATSWKDGSITGLRARGGYEVDMEWKDGELVYTQISNPAGGEIPVRYKEKTVTVRVDPAKPLRLNGQLEIIL